jgi:phosphatidylglycerol:prolipoprotein diacylglycerol transferase
VWNLLVFGVLWFCLRKPLQDRPGALALCYLGFYSVGRFFVEGLRIDSLMLGEFRVAQLVSLALVAASAVGLAALLRRRG